MRPVFVIDRPARLAICLLTVVTLGICAFFGAREIVSDRRLAESIVRSAFCTAEISDAEIYKYREIYDFLTER